MRIWVIISSVIILLFCVPGLVLAVFAPDWKDLLVLIVLNALAIHGLYYARLAVPNPEQGYRHLAANQLVLGIVCALLVLRLNAVLADPALWDEIYSKTSAILEQVYNQLATIFRQMSSMIASQQEIEAELRETVEPFRRSMAIILYVAAALVVLSQTWFAWILYRRARPSTP